MRYETVFTGRAAEDAPPYGRQHPLVLLSHGDKGSRYALSWLAEALAARGYIVAAVDHWLNTHEKNVPEETIRVWNRPGDLSFVLTQLLDDPAWGPRIDGSRLGVAGHSSGGYAALALAGAIYSPPRMLNYCQSPEAGPNCKLASDARLDMIDFGHANRPWRDERIRAALALAPALGPGLEPNSLRAIRVPVQLVAAANDELVPHAHNAARIAPLIPGSRLLTVPDGGHFVFLPQCSVAGKVLLWFHPYDLCGRRHDVDRAVVHATVAGAAVRFFEDALAPAAAPGPAGD